MLNKIKEFFRNRTKEKTIEENKKILLIYGAIFIVCFITLLSFQNIRKTEIQKMEKEFNNILSKNYDNYSETINLYLGEEEYKLDYKTDSKINIYSSDTFSKTEYVLYDNKLYYFENDKLIETNVNEINDMFNDKLYNLEFIINLIKKSKLEFSRDNNAYCIIDLTDFFEEYNQEYNENVVVNGEGKVKVIISFDKKLNSISLIYDDVIKNLTGEEKEIQYIININNTGNNNFDNYLKYLENNN